MAQHTEMKKQLTNRHTDMENNINQYTEKVQHELGNYMESVSQQLVDGHNTLKILLEGKLLKVVNDTYSIVKTIASRTAFNGVNIEHSFMRNEPDDTYYVSTAQISDNPARKVSCGFDLSSVSSGLTMNMAVGDNTTLFVKEDISQPAGAIPLVLVADEVRKMSYGKELWSLTNWLFSLLI
jgi:hypothetical protein